MAMEEELADKELLKRPLQIFYFQKNHAHFCITNKRNGISYLLHTRPVLDGVRAAEDYDNQLACMH